MEELICAECGKVVEKEFNFCPWCGNKKNENDELSVYNDSRERINSEYKKHKINDMTKKISELERELTVLVQSAEIEK